MNNLKHFIATITAFSEESWLILQDCLEELSCKKNEILLKEGEVCNSVFFISTGLCKACYNRDGREVNTAFYFENEFATNIKSLTTSSRSAYYLKTCEASTIIRLDKARLLSAYKAAHQVEAFGRKALEIIVARQEEHATSFQLLTPAERLENLTARHPAFLQRISLTQTASYLGISRETLSRLRKAK
jgi:CRP-like cAMP-binding protein